MNKKVVNVAHSPDADDIFMYYAIDFGWVSSEEIDFTHVGLDIETLNVEAMKGSYEATAISFALYPYIKEEYALLNTAVSFGQGYGPKLIKQRGKTLKRNFKVALSGKHTTNAMLFKIAYPDARIVYMNFLEIEAAVLKGDVDAGVLIHESILAFDERLEVERELWDIWQSLSGEALPLPLGGMALRRSMPLNRAITVQALLAKAVDVGVRHAAMLSQMLLQRGLVRIGKEALATYLNLYANDESVTLSDLQLRAIDKLFEIGHAHGFYETRISASDFMIPTEYETLRRG